MEYISLMTICIYWLCICISLWNMINQSHWSPMICITRNVIMLTTANHVHWQRTPNRPTFYPQRFKSPCCGIWDYFHTNNQTHTSSVDSVNGLRLMRSSVSLCTSHVNVKVKLAKWMRGCYPCIWGYLKIWCRFDMHVCFYLYGRLYLYKIVFRC